MDSSSPAYLREVQITYRKKRVKNGTPIGETIEGPGQIIDLFENLQNETKEKLIAVALDQKLKILCFEVVAIGSVNAIHARPFEALRSAIALNAYGLILVHNHPSGDPTPSDDDRSFTKTLDELTRKGGICLYDHIIIGDHRHYSFAQAGLLGDE